MTRMFYSIENKIYFDTEAFLNMAEENAIGIDEIYDIFDVSTAVAENNLIEV
jgi:hypothetical protein